jgi:hypothetical protein
MKAAVALVVAALFLAAAFVMMDITGGPFEDAHGTVRSVTAGTGPGQEVASVVLADGRIVLATVRRSGIARPGDAVELSVHRGVISGTSSYEVVGAQETATK